MVFPNVLVGSYVFRDNLRCYIKNVNVASVCIDFAHAYFNNV